MRIRSIIWIISAGFLVLAATAMGMFTRQSSADSWKPLNDEVKAVLVPETMQPAPMKNEAKPTVSDIPALININTATAEELDRLPGIGPAKAQAIIAYREQNGGFKTAEQLMEVKGIGPKIFAKLKASIRLSEP